MKHGNDNAMTIATLGFAVFASVIIIAAVIFIAAMVNQQSATTDTYGNTLTGNSTPSQNLVTSLSSEEEYSMVPLVLLIFTIFLCVVLFAAWVAPQYGISI
jgi:heme/copper-type cytochrome/quinol oxidase subunit 4